MTLKEEIYQAVHDYVEQRIKQFDDADYKATYSSDSRSGRLNELLKIQNMIYKMFADYNEKLAEHADIKPVRIDTNELITKHYP